MCRQMVSHFVLYSSVFALMGMIQPQWPRLLMHLKKQIFPLKFSSIAYSKAAR